MKLKIFILAALTAVTFTACTNTTDYIGSSLINNSDALFVTDSSFQTYTQSVKAGRVLARNSSGYVGKVKDPETGAYVTGDYMAQFYALPNPGFIQKDSIRTIASDGGVKPLHTYLNLFFEDYYGNSLAPMKLKVEELSKPVPEGVNYYSDFDPEAEGYVKKDGLTLEKTYTVEDRTLSDSSRTANDGMKGITISLDGKKYVHDGVTYPDFGAYIMRTYYAHPEYFKTSKTFLNNVFPGFYIKYENGLGAMAKVEISQVYMEQLTDTIVSVSHTSTVNGSDVTTTKDSLEYVTTGAYLYGTDEVLQTNKITNDEGTLDRLVADNSCSYLKTPAGIFTEITLPINEIMTKHENDSINSAKLVLTRINNTTDSNFKLGIPQSLLIIPEDSLQSFFEKDELINYKNSFSASFDSSSNTYTFNNISGLITDMYKKRNLSSDYNKAIIVPVTISTATRNNVTYITRVVNDMSLSSTKLVGGPNHPVKMTVIYSRFNK
ncbi:MAG: DUF4270 domain-containing protein [Prevotella sp.]|jgi:hypothetical protein|nr:DUF4270 domain-containing protein [Prevotella sp.]MCH3991740.1 DUF4270 domain-containing protein [Prevotella sp.]MCI1474853.1 DUF4270 domain-containing protein [Prevotella sp.]MCI1518300.1 DUF4270 domain-containing protein [Prevotella sp.]MCI1550142.1 DUF4270 domain-containing protein [Prevotella sp.]MCI1595906.1 DUF4270 domain-containing protein [Prevotella sp.]